MNKQVLSLMASCALVAGSAMFGQSTQPDNTKVNKADRAPGAVTADQQKMNKSDRETARQIRKSIVADKTLSMYAHNIKVIVQNGNVTLKGPVHTEEEKKTIESYASKVASTVDNQITVKGDSEADRSKQ